MESRFLETKGIAIEQVNDSIYKLAKDNNRIAIVTLLDELKKADVDFNAIKDEFRTAVSRIASENNTIALEFLLKIGDEIEAPSLISAVKGAASGGHLDLVIDLLNKGAPLNAAFSGAITGNHLHIIEYLMNHAKTDEDILLYATKFAASRGKDDIVEIFLAKENYVNHAIYEAAKNGHFKLMENLINRIPSPPAARQAAAFAIDGACSGDQFAHAMGVTRFLAPVRDPSLRLRLKQDLECKKIKIIRKDMTLTLKAYQCGTFMHARQISFQQKRAWDLPEIQGVLAFCQLSNHLPCGTRDAYFLIAAFLVYDENDASLSSIDEKEIKDMFLKMQSDIRKVDMYPENKNKKDSYVNFIRSYSLFEYRDPKTKLPEMNPVFDDKFYKL